MEEVGIGNSDTVFLLSDVEFIPVCSETAPIEIHSLEIFACSIGAPIGYCH